MITEKYRFCERIDLTKILTCLVCLNNKKVYPILGVNNLAQLAYFVSISIFRAKINTLQTFTHHFDKFLPRGYFCWAFFLLQINLLSINLNIYQIILSRAVNSLPMTHVLEMSGSHTINNFLIKI